MAITGKYIWPRKHDALALFVVASCFFVVLKIHQYLAFNVGMDVADFELPLWNTLHGRFLQMPCTSTSFFGLHFMPVLLLILPFYAIVQSPYTLLVFQAVGCSAAIFPLYRLASRFTPDRWPPFAISLAFCVSRVVNNGLMYDFHPEILYPAIFFGLFLALEKERWKLYYLLLVLAIMIKEDAFIAMVGVGCFVFFSGQRKHGIITTVVSATGFLFVMLLIIPFFKGQPAGSDYQFITHWSGYGSTQKEILLNFLNPLRHIGVIFTPMKLRQMFNLFSVFLFLPFVSWRAFVFLVLPNWFMLYSSSLGELNGPLIHYGLLITPFLFYATLNSIGILTKRWGNARTIILWASTLVFVVQLGNSRLFKQVFQDEWRIPERYGKTVYEVMRSIPPNVGVSAQVYLEPHIAPHPCRTFFPHFLEKVDFIFLDLKGNRWPLPEDQYGPFVDSIRHSQGWKAVVDRDDFLVLSRVQ